MSKLRIGYVPEHFSSPLLQLAKQFDAISLVSCPSGTGQLISAIKNDEIDIAIALTEALITGIAQKSAEYKLVGTYVTSPLNWAVIVGKDAPYKSLADIRGKTIGISRIGSGSQVMASYMYLREGWTDANGQVEDIHFEVLDSFKNLRDGVNDGRAAAFMWEHFTTKPYLDEVRFIDHVLTPWSSWMIAASPKATTEHKALLNEFLDRLSQSVRHFDDAEARKTTSKEFVMNHFSYPEDDVKAWLEGVRYPTDVRRVEQKTLDNTLQTLEKAGVLQKPALGWRTDNFVDTSIASLQ